MTSVSRDERKPVLNNAAIVASTGLSDPARIIGQFLYEHRNNETHEVWWSVPGLSEELAISESTVRRALGELTAHGVVVDTGRWKRFKGSSVPIRVVNSKRVVRAAGERKPVANKKSWGGQTLAAMTVPRSGRRKRGVQLDRVSNWTPPCPIGQGSHGPIGQGSHSPIGHPNSSVRNSSIELSLSDPLWQGAGAEEGVELRSQTLRLEPDLPPEPSPAAPGAAIAVEGGEEGSSTVDRAHERVQALANPLVWEGRDAWFEVLADTPAVVAAWPTGDRGDRAKRLRQLGSNPGTQGRWVGRRFVDVKYESGWSAVVDWACERGRGEHANPRKPTSYSTSTTTPAPRPRPPTLPPVDDGPMPDWRKDFDAGAAATAAARGAV